MTANRATALDLASRNDGYLVAAGDPAVESLKAAGLVFTRPVGDGYWIARAVVTSDHQARYLRPVRDVRPHLERREEIGAVA